MRKKFVLSGLACIVVAGIAFAEQGKGDVADENLIVVQDTKPAVKFSVEKSDLVRFTGSGIAGADISAKVEGPAKIVHAYNVRTLVNGRPLIGAGVKEFIVKPSAAGEVTLTITVKSPIPNTPPEVSKYTFSVE